MSLPEPEAALNEQERSRFAAAQSAADPRQAVLGVVEDIARERIAITVFSASTCRSGTMELERIFSSRPEVYPIGARKSKAGTNWAQQVLRDRKVFVGEGPLEMAAAFDDQERMASLGIRSIINVPIVVAERCVAVLNFGRATERISPADVLLAKCLAKMATAVFAGDR